jgi:uncharacterized protein YifE (UPF0438 family)
MADLTLEEVRLLLKWAHQLERLEKGEFEADTPLRQHFLSVCRGDAKPVTIYEKAYVKWRRTKPELQVYEKRLLAAPEREKVRRERKRQGELARMPAVLPHSIARDCRLSNGFIGCASSRRGLREHQRVCAGQRHGLPHPGHQQGQRR